MSDNLNDLIEPGNISTVKLVKTHPQESLNNKSNLSEEIIEAKKAEFEALKVELDKKKYLTSGDADFLRELRIFFTDFAEWTFNEALGIQQAITSIDREARDLRPKRSDTSCEVYFTSIELMALHHFISKFKSIGTQHVGWYLRIARPISDAITVVRADQQKLQDAEIRLAGLMHGISTDEEIADNSSENAV